MKKLICILIMTGMAAFFPVYSYAGWITANQCTVGWDKNNTSALVEGERLVYRVYLTNTVTDPSKTSPMLIGETQNNTLVVTLTIKGKYRAGVEAVLQVLADNNTTWEDVGESPIAWSDDPTVTKDGIIFGIRFYPAPAMPTGLTAG